MKKRICSLILGLLLSLMCVPAFASILINDTPITSTHISADGTFSYDADTKTLTLNNFESNGYNSAICANDGEIREIVLIGENTIIPNTSSYGVMISQGSLKISGSGSLEVKSHYAPLCVQNGAVTIDGATVTLTITTTSQHAMFAGNRIDLVNGAKLSVSSDCYYGTINIANPAEGIRVSGGSMLEVYGSKGDITAPFAGSLVVSDTSGAIILSGDFCTPAGFNGTADSVTLKPVLSGNAIDYGDEWTLTPGAASGRYAFTVKQTEVENNLYRVEIQGTEQVSSTAPLPETGDSSKPELWLVMSMLSVLGIIMLRRKARA